MILRLYKPCNANKLGDAIRATDAFSCRKLMPRPLTFLFCILAVCACAQAQATKPLAGANDNDRVIAARAIAALTQLDKDVIVYRSLGEFEEGRKLASVSLGTFQTHLRTATDEVESVLPHLNDARLKTAISNALASYRDGAYWWEKIDQPRVIHVSEFRANESDVTQTASFFSANLPYTVAIHWRQANKHLQRAIRQLG